MSVQYFTSVLWDKTLVSVEFIENNAITREAKIAGLVQRAIKITTGAPTATPGKFMGAARIYNEVDSTNYENTGTTASPVWALMATGAGGISQLTGDVTAGPGAGSQVATIAAGAVTNAKVANAAAIAFSKLAALPSTDILVGSAGNVATAVTVSKDLTMSNTGAATVVGIQGNTIIAGPYVAGDLFYFDGTFWNHLPIGTNGQVLTVVAGLPAWV